MKEKIFYSYGVAGTEKPTDAADILGEEQAKEFCRILGKLGVNSLSIKLKDGNAFVIFHPKEKALSTAIDKA